MQLRRLLYMSCLLLVGTTACQDELFLPLVEEKEVPVVQGNEILLPREYTQYTLTTEKLKGLEGCHIHAKEGFVFLSDSIVRNGRPITIEVEQNPYEEERFSKLVFADQEGTEVCSFSLRQANSLSQTQGEAYSAALLRSYGVGYGYDAFGEYASYNSVRDQVVSLPALRRYEQEHKTSCIVDDFAPDMETTVLEGNNSQQLLKAFSAHAGLGLDVGFFQAHVEGKYSRSDLKTNAYSFCTIINNYKSASRHIEPYNLAEIVRNNPDVLTEGFRYSIQKISDAVKGNNLDKALTYTEELFRIYGTHLIYHADLGGKLEFCSTFERAALDSQTTLSVAAEVSFLNMCGFKMEEGQTNTYSQTATRQSRSISAHGGDVTYTTEIINSEKDVLASGLVDDWYKSIYLDFDDPQRSNVELIDFKLFPIYELITDVGARSFVYAQLGMEVEYENDMFPRAYDTAYVQIDLNSSSSFSDVNNGVEYLTSGKNQVIVEIASEYLRIRGKQYKFRSLYPVLAGEVRREGIAVAQDSLYRILWKNMECTLVPIGEPSEYPTLYYNDGDLDILPVDDMTYSTDCQINRLFLYNWATWCKDIYKYGPYMIMVGAYLGMDQNYMPYYYINGVKDAPIGWEMFTIETEEALKELQEEYDIKEGRNGNGFYYFERFIIHDNNDNKFPYAMQCDSSGNQITIEPAETSYWAYLLFVRTSPVQY